MSLSQQLTIEQAISRAEKAAKQGNAALAWNLYNAVWQHPPSDPTLTKRLHKLQQELSRCKSVQVQTADPSPDRINALINLYHSGHNDKGRAGL